MKQVEFNNIFDDTIMPFINEICENNSLITINDLDKCKEEIYKAYTELNKRYKGQIFEKDADKVLLDRHKVASCICGAFLRFPIFNKTNLMVYLQKERSAVEVYFYYVNELVALYAAIRYLSFFMIYENQQQDRVVQKILSSFPEAPPITKNKRGFWNSVLFNLSQIKDEGQIGINHYDIYSYAMFFFWLERYFNEKLAA